MNSFIMFRNRGTRSATRKAIARSPITMATVSQSIECELDPVLEEPSPEVSSDTSPDNAMTISSKIWMKNVLRLSIIPIVTAPAAGTATRSKKRISRATRAAELGTARAMNWIPYWSISTGQ
jgi:hypothetical protein